MCSHELLELREHAEAGRRPSLDGYGTTNEAERFVVAAEACFLRPDQLRRHEAALHALLAGSIASSCGRAPARPR